MSGSASTPHVPSGVPHPIRDSFSCPVLGLQTTHGEPESYCAFHAWCAHPNSLNVMGDGLPTSLELFHAAQEIVPIESLDSRLLDNHRSLTNTHYSDGGRLELVCIRVHKELQ